MCELRADRTGLRLSGASGEEWMQFWEIARLLQAEEKRQARAERGKCAVPRLPALSQSGVPPLPPAAKSHDGAGGGPGGGGTIWISSGISGWLCGRGGAGMSERHGEESRI